MARGEVVSPGTANTPSNWVLLGQICDKNMSIRGLTDIGQDSLYLIGRGDGSRYINVVKTLGGEEWI